MAPPFGFPWATFTVNMAGVAAARAHRDPGRRALAPTRFVRPFAAIGFCGGFTTFSTLVVEAAQLTQHGRVGLAVVYLVASLVVGLAAAVLGMSLARGRLLPLLRLGPIPDPDDVGMLDSDPESGGDPCRPTTTGPMGTTSRVATVIIAGLLVVGACGAVLRYLVDQVDPAAGSGPTSPAAPWSSTSPARWSSAC